MRTILPAGPFRLLLTLALASPLASIALDGPRQDRIDTLTSQLPEHPCGFGPTIDDRAAWGVPEIAQRTLAVRREAEKLLGKDFPRWDEAAYLEYSQKGTRPNGERMMNARKAWLYPLALAECVENQGRFLPALERAMLELDDQQSWTWPAHDRDLRNLRRHDFEVDLLAADTAHELAEVLYLLGPKLRPEVRVQTMEALELHVFAPLRQTFKTGNKDNWWLRADHNWNAVCLKGSVAAALSVLPGRRDRALFAAAGEYYIPRYVDGFTSDGYTTEGPGYWNYGFSHFCILREALCQATSGQIDLFADRKVRGMALYGYRFEMSAGNVAAFGDAALHTHMDDFTRAYTNEALGLGEPQHLREISLTGAQSSNDAPLCNAVFALFGRPAPQVANAAVSEETQIGLQSYFASVGVLVSRPSPGDKLAIAIKSGGNENHSHNDIGSYTIGLASEQPTGDVGRTQYSAKTFSKERYSIPGISSWGHPVPVIDGSGQLEADKVKPKVLSVRLTDELDEIVINTADAYAVKGLHSLTRTMLHDRRHGGSVSITDRFEYLKPGKFEVAITTVGNWRQLGEGQLELWEKNEHLLARIEASSPFAIEPVVSNEEGLKFVRLGIRMKDNARQGFVRVTYTPMPAK